MTSNHDLAVKLVNSLCDHNFMHGWGGDKSQEYKNKHIEYYENNFSNIHENYVYGWLKNLKYCGWSFSEIKELAEKCGFSLNENKEWVKNIYN